MSDYAFVHDGTAYTPNQTDVPAERADVHNKRIETEELARWAETPDTMLVYYHFPAETTFPSVFHPRPYRPTFYPVLSGAEVKTWLGTVVGAIIRAHVYRHNFGGRFVSIRVRGTNGATYYGRGSWDYGQCVLLRKMR
jgi:hypothetical protein